MVKMQHNYIWGFRVVVYRAAFFFVGRSDVSTYNRYRVYAGGSFHSFGFVGAM